MAKTGDVGSLALGRRDYSSRGKHGKNMVSSRNADSAPSKRGNLSPSLEARKELLFGKQREGSVGKVRN